MKNLFKEVTGQTMPFFVYFFQHNNEQFTYQLFPFCACAEEDKC